MYEDDHSERPYLEILRASSLSVGVYPLPARATDPQRPHAEDEVYHVVASKGRIRVGTEAHAVKPKTVVFVGAGGSRLAETGAAAPRCTYREER